MTPKPYELPKLAYAYDALEPVCTREMVELHHSKHHAAYVKGANRALANLAEARADSAYETIGQLQKDLAFNLSGHVLHSIFWQNLSPDGGGEPQGELAAAVKRWFGGAAALREHMTSAAVGVQGSGWAALCYEPVAGALLIEQIYDHQGNVGQAAVPLLVLDMWEHAYYLKYRNEKQQWAERFFDLVDWRDVARRLERAAALDSTLLD